MAMIRTREMMKLFTISRQTMTKMMDEGLPYYKVGRILYFDDDEVVGWIKLHMAGTARQIQEEEEE